MTTALRPRPIRLTPRDEAALATIRRTMGLSSDALAVRVVLRRFAQVIREQEAARQQNNDIWTVAKGY